MGDLNQYAVRKDRGNDLESLVDSWFDKLNIPFIKSGYENYFSKESIQHMKNSAEFKHERFFPDRYLPNHNLYIEITSAVGIDKEKYDFLMEVFSDCIIVNKQLDMYKISDIRFQIPMPRIWGFEVPVQDTYWRNPLLMGEQKRYEFMHEARKRGKPTSAKAMAFFDWDASMKYANLTTLSTPSR